MYQSFLLSYLFPFLPSYTNTFPCQRVSPLMLPSTYPSMWHSLFSCRILFAVTSSVKVFLTAQYPHLLVNHWLFSSYSLWHVYLHVFIYTYWTTKMSIERLACSRHSARGCTYKLRYDMVFAWGAQCVASVRIKGPQSVVEKWGKGPPSGPGSPEQGTSLIRDLKDKELIA